MGREVHLDPVDEVVFRDTINVLQSVRRGHSPARSARNEINLRQRETETE